MKKLIFTVCSALTLLYSCTSQQEQISARIYGWGNDTLFVRYYTIPDEKNGVDTVYAKKGKFSYTLPVEGIDIAQLHFYRKADMYPRRGGDYLPSTRAIELLVSPGEYLKVKGKSRHDAVLEYTVSGSRLMEDLTKIRAQTLSYEVQKDSNEFRLIDAMERNALPEEQAEFFTRRKELNYEIREVERTHIRAHPDRISSGALILKQPLDSFPDYYARLSEEVKTGILKTPLDAQVQRSEEYQIYLANQRKEFIGNPAPDFTLMNIDGNPFTLSGFNTDKYIVLDFWGSWCAPCLSGVPEMKKYYDRYGQKLEIIGIACRDEEETWRKAVADHRLEWLHLFNDESSAQNNVAARYAVGAYPTKIILSPDKTVLAVFEGEGADFYRKLDELLK